MCCPILSAQWINNESRCPGLALRLVVEPFELSKYATIKTALQFLHEAEVVVHCSLFADADVALLLMQQDPPIPAAALAAGRI